MKLKAALLVLTLSLTTNVFAQQEAKGKYSARTEVGTLTSDEVRFLNKLASYNKEFVFNNNVVRCYVLSPDSSRTPTTSYIVFDKVDGAIVANGKPTDFASYAVSFTASSFDGLIVSYNYSMGRASTGDGSALINDQGVVENNYSCNSKDECIFEVRKNGVLVELDPKARNSGNEASGVSSVVYVPVREQQITGGASPVIINPLSIIRNYKKGTEIQNLIKAKSSKYTFTSANGGSTTVVTNKANGAVMHFSQRTKTVDGYDYTVYMSIKAVKDAMKKFGAKFDTKNVGGANITYIGDGTDSSTCHLIQLKPDGANKTKISYSYECD